MAALQIERFIEQKCIGYNSDYTLMYTANLVQFKDGSTGTLYAIYSIEDNTMVKSYTKERPYVYHKVNNVP